VNENTKMYFFLFRDINVSYSIHKFRTNVFLFICLNHDVSVQTEFLSFFEFKITKRLNNKI